MFASEGASGPNLTGVTGLQIGVGALSLFLVLGCGSGSAGTPTPGVACGLSGWDSDGDTISDEQEGRSDPDGDGVPNDRDLDSDGDGWSDRLEAGDEDCLTRPGDVDGDGIPNFLDPDANGDGVLDRAQGEGDRDDDGVPDVFDPDVDGDGLLNPDELLDGELVDSDGDGAPDVFDTDSDDDRILDGEDGALDVDGDGLPNFRDEDSDGDGLPDRTEAGDDDLSTSPVACAIESGSGDGLADFEDADRDDDGLADSHEAALGTALCGVDTDEDGFGDLVEWAYEQIACRLGTETACGCATNGACGIPDTDFYVVLPEGDPVQQAYLDFSTTIQRADVFFLMDSSESMGPTLDVLRATVATPTTGLMDRMQSAVPDTWLSGGRYTEWPFAPYGGGGDTPLALVSPSTPFTLPGGVEGSGRALVAERFGMLGVAQGGGDLPEAHSDALYQAVVGRGGVYESGAQTLSLPNLESDCFGRGFGAACFREDSLPVVVHFTDACAHNGPSGGDSGCTVYEGISPSPATYDEVMTALQSRGVRYIGVNTHPSEGCAGRVDATGTLPCHFMRQTALSTGSVSDEGEPMVLDLPSGTANEPFADALVGAVETLATRVPVDVDTRTRDGASLGFDNMGVDARQFVVAVEPACDGMMTCYWDPDGVPTHPTATPDARTFFGVLPRSTVRFRASFANTMVRGTTASRVFVAGIDVRADERSVLQTRLVFIVVPAVSIAPPH